MIEPPRDENAATPRRFQRRLVVAAALVLGLGTLGPLGYLAVKWDALAARGPLEGGVSGLHVSPRGDRVVAWNAKGEVRVLDPRNPLDRRLGGRRDQGLAGAHDLAILPDGRFGIVARDYGLALRDLDAREPERAIPYALGRGLRVAVSADGTRYARTGRSFDGSSDAIWFEQLLPDPRGYTFSTVFELGPGVAVRADLLAITRDGKRAATAHNQLGDSLVLVATVEKGIVREITLKGAVALALAFRPDDSLIVFTSAGDLRIYDPSGTVTLDRELAASNGAAISTTGLVAWFDAEGPIGLFDTVTGRPLANALSLGRGCSTKIAIAADGSLVAVGREDGSVELFPLR